MPRRLPDRARLLRGRGLRESPPEAIGVLLAAGASTRFGAPKMLAPVPPAGRPMLAHVLDVWRGAGFSEVIVVLGSGADALREAVEEKTANSPLAAPVRWVENPDWGSGMFSSVQAGLTAALMREPHTTHVALSPADLPFLRKSSLRRLLAALDLPDARRERTLVVPTCGRRRGHPLFLPRELAARVLGWPADARLNRLFAEPDVSALHLEGFDESVLADVDRPADLLTAPA